MTLLDGVSGWSEARRSAWGEHKPKAHRAAPPRARSALLLPLLERPAKSIGLTPGLDDVSSIPHLIQQGLAELTVRDDLRPLRKRQVGGHDHHGLLHPLRHHLE